MVYRNMRKEDLDQVCQIEQKIFSDPWSSMGFFTSMKENGNIYLVAEENHEILGYCGLWGVAGEGQICNVAVKEEARFRGIGYGMIKKLLETGREQGLTEFTLEVRESNLTAIRLYEKFGFVSEGIRKNFYDNPKENAVIMWNRIKDS